MDNLNKIIILLIKSKKKVIVEGNEKQEQRADKFALNTMIDEQVWKLIEENKDKNYLLKVSRKNKIPMSFIIGRLAKIGKIKYSSML